MCNKTIEFMFAGENMFWARLRPILARAFIYAQEINCSTIVMTLEGIEEMKTEKKKKKTTKQCEEYFSHQRCKKTSTNTVMASRF